MRDHTWPRPARVRRALLGLESPAVLAGRTPNADRRATLNRCQCVANVVLTGTRTSSQHPMWTILVMAIRPGAAASDANANGTTDLPHRLAGLVYGLLDAHFDTARLAEDVAEDE